MSRPLVDTFGRVHRDLRISVTDRCNFRCTYCMPEDGLDWLDRSEILTFEEITTLARIMVEQYAVDSIRLTGGEPLVRKGIMTLFERLGRHLQSGALDELTLTTNGSQLATHAQQLEIGRAHV